MADCLEMNSGGQRNFGRYCSNIRPRLQIGGRGGHYTSPCPNATPRSAIITEPNRNSGEGGTNVEGQ